jgi:hypothetical protein
MDLVTDLFLAKPQRRTKAQRRELNLIKKSWRLCASLRLGVKQKSLPEMERDLTLLKEMLLLFQSELDRLFLI